MIDINVNGAYYMLKEVASYMREVYIRDALDGGANQSGSPSTKNDNATTDEAGKERTKVENASKSTAEKLDDVKSENPNGNTDPAAEQSDASVAAPPPQPPTFAPFSIVNTASTAAVGAPNMCAYSQIEY